MEKSCEIAEGSILFEKINEKVPFYYNLGWLALLLGGSYLQIDSFWIGLLGIVLLLLHLTYYIPGILYGFKNETFQCYYFSDRLVFYRVSNYLDKYYTKGKTTNDLVNELNELLKDKYQNKDETLLDWKIEQLEKGIIISKNKRQPHKIEHNFEDFEFFKSGKDGVIECVSEGRKENDKDDETFYKYLKLTKEYKKCQNQIVDFLNKKIREAKTNTPNF